MLNSYDSTCKLLSNPGKARWILYQAASSKLMIQIASQAYKREDNVNLNSGNKYLCFAADSKLGNI